MGKGEGRGGGRKMVRVGVERRAEEKGGMRRRKMGSSLPLGDKGLRVRHKSRAKQTF